MALIIFGHHHGAADSHERDDNIHAARELIRHYAKDAEEINEPARNTVMAALYNLVTLPHRRHAGPHHLALVGHGDHTGAFVLNSLDGQDAQFSADDLIDFFHANPDHCCHRLDIHLFGCDQNDWQNTLQHANAEDLHHSQGRRVAPSLPTFTVYVHSDVVRQVPNPRHHYAHDDSEEEASTCCETDLDSASEYTEVADYYGHHHHAHHGHHGHHHAHHHEHHDHLDEHLRRPDYYYPAPKGSHAERAQRDAQRQQQHHSNAPHGHHAHESRDSRDRHYDHEDRRGNGYAAAPRPSAIRPYQSYWN
jgi:hypothetical protein